MTTTRTIDEAIESMGYGHAIQLLADLGYDTDRYIDGGAREALTEWAHRAIESALDGDVAARVICERAIAAARATGGT